MSNAGIPADILKKLKRRKNISKNVSGLDLNILWPALHDAIEFMKSVIDAEIPRTRRWRKESPAIAKEIDRYRASLKYYDDALGVVIKEGNKRGWR